MLWNPGPKSFQMICYCRWYHYQTKITRHSCYIENKQMLVPRHFTGTCSDGSALDPFSPNLAQFGLIQEWQNIPYYLPNSPLVFTDKGQPWPGPAQKWLHGPTYFTQFGSNLALNFTEIGSILASNLLACPLEIGACLILHYDLICQLYPVGYYYCS